MLFVGIPPFVGIIAQTLCAILFLPVTDAVNSTDALWILPVYVYPGVLHIWLGRWLCLDLRTTPVQGFGKTANERFATRQGRETQDERKLQENVFKCEGVEHVNGVINNKVCCWWRRTQGTYLGNWFLVPIRSVETMSGSPYRGAGRRAETDRQTDRQTVMDAR